MNRKEAEKLAMSYIKESYSLEGDELVLEDDSTIERVFGWVFFYNSETFIKTKDVRYALVGNAPIVVTKAGKLYETGTAYPLEFYLNEFESNFKEQ